MFFSIILSTKKYNNNITVFANNATFDNINLTYGQPIMTLDYLQTNCYNRFCVDNRFDILRTQIDNKLLADYYTYADLYYN